MSLKGMKMKKSRIFGALALVAGAFLGATLIARAQQTEPVVTDTVTIKTSAGDIVVELYGADAPKTVENFTGLAKKGFYKGILFHRVVPGFVIQAGDPKSTDTTLRAQWGTGGESIYNKPFEDELNPNTISYQRGYVEGTLAMANRGPNTNTSQFFIILNNNVKLQKHYTIFGKVVRGMDVVKVIESGKLNSAKAPENPVKILGTTVVHVQGK